MKRNRQTASGMTLIEIMVTMFLIMIGLLVVMGSMVAVAKSNRFAQRIEVANSLIRMEMERMKNAQFADIASEEGAYGEYADHPDYRHRSTVIENGTIKRIQLEILFENDRRSAEATTSVSDI